MLTKNDLRDMLERQLDRLEEKSEQAAYTKALAGLTDRMLAVTRRLEDYLEPDRKFPGVAQTLADACQAVNELLRECGAQLGEQHPLTGRAREIRQRLEDARAKLEEEETQ